MHPTTRFTIADRHLQPLYKLKETGDSTVFEAHASA